MPATSNGPTPGPSTSALSPSNSKKRHSSEDNEHTPLHSSKRWKGESPSKAMKDKKKRRKRKRKMTIVGDSENRPRSRAESKSRTSVSVKPSSVRENGPTEGEVPGLAEATSGASNEEATLTEVIVSQAKLHLTDVNVKQLNTEIQAKLSLVQQHEKALSQVQQSITCQVCLDLLYKPYALAPCGHTACHSCLVSWFTSQPVHDGAVPEVHRPHSFYTRKKTCPHCRAIVRERPVEVWAIKNIVTNLVQSGLLTNMPQPTADETRSTENKDPWHNIFRPTHKYLETHYGEERPVTDLSVEETGMYDAEDGGIYRCLDCMHEIEDGICSGCDRAYDGHVQLEAQRGDTESFWDDWDGARYMEDLMGLWGNPAIEMYESSDSDSDLDIIGHALLSRRTRALFGDEDVGIDIDIEEPSGSEDESYEGSFIDDGSDGVTVLTDTGRHPQQSRRHRGRMSVTDALEFFYGDNGSGSENDANEDRDASRRVYRNNRSIHMYDQSDSEDDSENGEMEGGELSADDSDGETTSRLPTRSRSRRFHTIDDSESDEEDDGSIPGPPARLRHLFTEDDDESD
ncbi:hypothetical protein E1B28_006451 [Marasmius oreades]|uniref:RING-type domain-containing protein n=1 Tax=Marasmius oreades TaxID=181124 RepID=A0A9P7S5B5_9AGAR|nr:uncharacterized protein E1B28_006451 [Marasmius oreades]KAG7095741.1 hypothetical protein E1B28_006451 [Marasmius oreades]